MDAIVYVAALVCVSQAHSMTSDAGGYSFVWLWLHGLVQTDKLQHYFVLTRLQL